jgi:hypothetical protein
VIRLIVDLLLANDEAALLRDVEVAFVASPVYVNR